MTTVTFNSSEPKLTLAYLTTRVKPASFAEQALVTIWLFVTFTTFPGDELILYPSALLFLALFLQYREFTIPLLAKSWILLLVPVLGVLSAGWSPAPADAFRVGIMMVFGVVIMVTIATRLTREQIMRGLLLAGTLAIIKSIPEMNALDEGGSYGSKNIFAFRMLFVTVGAVGVAFNSKENILLRLLGLVVAPAAFYFMILANSATALVLSIVGIALLTVAWLVWQPATHVRHLRSFVSMAAVVLGVLGLTSLLAIPNQTLMSDFLAALGKDSTLTNRTLFWEAGNRIAQQNPLFGLGLEGFWRPEVGAAQTVNELDHRDPGTRHSFHNSYIEVRVALGAVGMMLFIAALAWTYFNNLASWSRSRGMGASFFLVIGTIALITTFTESVMFSAFDTMVLFFYLGALTGLAEKYHSGTRQMVRLRPTEA